MYIICSECRQKLDTDYIMIKRVDQYEGMDVAVFDCQLCKKEVSELSCDPVVEDDDVVRDGLSTLDNLLVFLETDYPRYRDDCYMYLEDMRLVIKKIEDAMRSADITH